MKNNFTHLHLHTEFSCLDGFGNAENYAKTAKEKGFSALAITDHGNVDGTIKFQQACEKLNIKSIIGCELYFVDDLHKKEKGETRYHITLLVKNQTGWENLLKILTVANLEGFYRKPRADPKLLLKHLEGLIVMTACSSTFLYAKWGERFLCRLKQEIGRDLYLEIMPLEYEQQRKTNQFLVKLSKKYHIPLLATNDIHYPTEKDAKSQEVLLAIQRKAKWDDPKRWKFDAIGLYLKTEREMKESFEHQDIVPRKAYEPALGRTAEIVEKCKNFRIEQRKVSLPTIPGYENVDETKMLFGLIKKGYQIRILQKKTSSIDLSIYKLRMTEEFKLICSLEFQRYFLIVWELIQWCKENDIMVGPGRGSVGGSLIAYLLGITDVDPIVHKLLFSRFISPARIDLPDIDMDFEDAKRNLIREHLERNYGESNTAGVSTFLRMKGRAAVRDVGRVFSLPYKDVDAAAKSIVVRSGGDFRADFSVEDAFDTFEDGIKFKKQYPEQARIITQLEGQVRGVGQHAAAVCVSRDNLREGKRCNLCLRKGVAVVNWDKYDAEYVGLMKLDILGLSALTILNQTKKMIKAKQNHNIIFTEMPITDRKVYAEISKGNTIGAFQIGSSGLGGYCKELGIDNFNDLVNATSLWRPGPLRSGMATEFVYRKHHKKKWDYIHPAMKELTGETYGIILYQEQIMKFMYDFAGLPWRTCDMVRKVISKSQGEELFEKFGKQFVEGCQERKTLTRKESTRIWKELSSFGSYGFNRAHAVEYSLITYWDMFCKVYYPAEFMASSLTYGNSDKKEEYILECKRLGLKIQLPKNGISKPFEWIVKGNILYAPFIEIKGVGVKSAEKIVSLFDRIKADSFFLSNKEKSEGKLNKAIVANLQKIGSFDKEKDLSDEELSEVNHLFPFDLSKDPMRLVRGIHQAMANSKILSYLKDTDFLSPSSESQFFFGKIPELKFGYRKNVLKNAKEFNQKIAGIKGALGGVYGFFKDSSAAQMLVFLPEVYAKRKDKIEHCSNKWLIVKANHPKPQTTMFCEEIAIEEEIKSCRIKQLGLRLLRKGIPFENKEMLSCRICSLSAECTQAILPNSGRYNVMIVGEAPGREEDFARTGFIGKAGKVLWRELLKYKLKREMFHTTNVAKCYPGRAKTPSKKQIRICGNKWLAKEIEYTKPILALVFGNTGLKFFKEQDSGIMSLSGTTEWSVKYNMWLCWCIHPAAVLYENSNQELFQQGIDNFQQCFIAISGSKK